MMCHQAVVWDVGGSRCEKVPRLPEPLLQSSLATLQTPDGKQLSLSNIVIQILSQRLTLSGWFYLASGKAPHSFESRTLDVSDNGSVKAQ